MKERVGKILELIVLLVITGLGVVTLLNYTQYVNRLPVFQRVAGKAVMQFVISGLGAVIIMLWKNEKFSDFGLKKENVIKSIGYGAVFIALYILATVLGGGSINWMPFKRINETWLALGLAFPLNILGIALIAISWGFFGGYNLVYISRKINGLFKIQNPFLRPAPLIIFIGNIVIHMFVGQSLLGAVYASIAAYAVTIIPEIADNSWGSILIFMLLWNAL